MSGHICTPLTWLCQVHCRVPCHPVTASRACGVGINESLAPALLEKISRQNTCARFTAGQPATHSQHEGLVLPAQMSLRLLLYLKKCNKLVAEVLKRGPMHACIGQAGCRQHTPRVRGRSWQGVFFDRTDTVPRHHRGKQCVSLAFKC